MTVLRNDLAEIDIQHHLHHMTNLAELRARGPDMVMRAEGVFLHLQDGATIMDTNSALQNVSLGYGNERLCDAAYRAMKELSFGYTAYRRSNPPIAALAAKLCEITPDQFVRFTFASSGSEAIETAIKIARYYWRLRGKPEKVGIISRRRSYHGNLIASASATGNPIFHDQFGLPISDIFHLTDSTHWYTDGGGMGRDAYFAMIVENLERQIAEIGADNVGIFIAEPVQTGNIVPPESYWRAVRTLCDRNDILIIADEIVSGFGKTGKMFGFENFEFEPDLFAMAKGLSSGYFPISAIAVGHKVDELLVGADEIFRHILTNSGHPVGAAVALETIAIIEEEGLVARVRDEIGPHFSSRLWELLDIPCVAHVQNLGVLSAFDVDLSGSRDGHSLAQVDAFLARVSAAAWRRGIAIRGNLQCLPMVITLDQVDTATERLRDAILEAWDEFAA